MDEIIELLNVIKSTLDFTGEELQLELPSIVVIGDPSCGKSSIIDSLLNMDILPKGTGIVTRCPTIINMIQDEGSVYARFSHNIRKMVFYTNEMTREITSQSKKILINNTQYSKKPIEFSLYSGKSLTYTIIEIPGLCPIGSAETLSPHVLIEDLIKENIKPSNLIILAVIEGKVDIKSCEIFKIIAKMGKMDQTIGVITKIDLCDILSIKSIMENTSFVPGRGWVLVKNRSENEIITGKKLDTLIETEKQVLKEKFPNIHHINGSSHLKQLINDIFKKQITDLLPDLVQKLHSNIAKSEKIIKQLKFFPENTDKTNTIIQICKDISEKINSSIGLYQRTTELEKINVGTIINNYMNEEFNKQVSELKEQKIYLRNLIITGVKNSVGLTGYVQIPDKAILSIIRLSNGKFQEIVIKILDKLRKCIKDSITGSLEFIQHYRHLHSVIEDLIVDFLDKNIFETKQTVETFIEIDSSHTYFGDLSFLNENWDQYRANTNLEIYNTVFKTDINLLNYSKKAQYDYDYYFIIDDECGYILSKEKILQRLFCFQNKQIYVKFINSVLSKRVIRISSKHGDNVVFDYKHIDIQVETLHEFQKWRQIFVSKGVLCEEIQQIYSKLNHANVTHEEMIKYERMCMVLEKYLSCNRVKIQDLMTKLIMKPVIYDFEQFCTYHLSSHVLKHNPEELFKISEEDRIDVKIKIEMNQSLKSCYEKFLEYMDKYQISYQLRTITFTSLPEDEEYLLESSDSNIECENFKSNSSSDDVFIAKKRRSGIEKVANKFVGFFKGNKFIINDFDLTDL